MLVYARQHILQEHRKYTRMICVCIPGVLRLDNVAVSVFLKMRTHSVAHDKQLQRCVVFWLYCCSLGMTACGLCQRNNNDVMMMEAAERSYV